MTQNSLTLHRKQEADFLTPSFYNQGLELFAAFSLWKRFASWQWDQTWRKLFPLVAETDLVVDFCLCLFCVAVGLLSPRNLRVSDEWYTRFRVAWDPVPAPVQGYRLIYSPEGELTSHQHPTQSINSADSLSLLLSGRKTPINMT